MSEVEDLRAQLESVRRLKEIYFTAFGYAVERFADTSGGDALEIACIRNELVGEATQEVDSRWPSTPR